MTDSEVVDRHGSLAACMGKIDKNGIQGVRQKERAAADLEDESNRGPTKKKYPPPINNREPSVQPIARREVEHQSEKYTPNALAKVRHTVNAAIDNASGRIRLMLR